MKQITRRILPVFLLAVLLVSCLTPVSAEESLTELQRAVCETAMAYYYRGPAVQYDSAILNPQGKDGDQRRSDYTSPEDATGDEIMYSVCSAYCFEVYYDTFGYKLNESPGNAATANLTAIPETDPIVAYRWTDKDGKPVDTAASEMREEMKPGDIVVVSMSDSGHAMLYLGEYFDGTPSLIHCSGNKYNIDVGTDVVETKQSQPTSNGGSIRIDPVDTFLYGSTPAYPLKGARRFCLLRPLNALTTANLTNNAKARLKYKGLNIDRRADHDRFRDVEPGGEITVTIDLQNNSPSAYTVPVTEKIPAGAALKAGSVTGSGSPSGDTVVWNVSLGAGEKKTVSYTVTVTGKRGDTVNLTGGDAGGIRANAIPVRIGGKHLTAEQIEKLKSVKDHKAEIEKKVAGGETLGNAVYEAVLGLYPQIPKMADAVNGSFTRSRTAGAIRLTPVESTSPEAAEIAKMRIPYYLGGTTVKTGGNGHDRVLDLAPFHLYPGDVILRGTSIGSSEKNGDCVYLGDNQVAYLSNGSLTVANADRELLKNFIYEAFLGMRPTLAYDDVNTVKAEAKPISFPDVKESDWFYGYVMDLAKEGIVGGMSDGTFQPAGTLTYGQALKLLICALDKDVGNASSGHWASGYLSAAQSKGWISGSVNLDAGVSRLAFCQVAAKAKGLTAQPESNPFTDTADPAVLALNKAGVIGGMGEGKFSPDTTLTRAQISKIIVELRKA